MKFKIERVSDRVPPVPSAVRGIVHKGTRADGSENVTEGWIIELNTLEDLLALEKEADARLVIGVDDFHIAGYRTEIDLPEIVIYDGYME